MTRFLSLTSFGLALATVACGAQSSRDTDDGTGGSGAVGGKTSGAGGQSAETGGSSGTPTTGGQSAGSVGDPSGAGMTASTTGGSSGAAGDEAVGDAGESAGGSAGSVTAGTAGSSGSAGSGDPPLNLPPLVISGPDAYWKTDAALTESNADAIVTVSDSVAQTWEGFGGAFNELGWSYLTSSEMQAQAIELLFSASDGANFAWGRLPIGASSYAVSRYTLVDAGDDPVPNADESNRPPADPSLSAFSLARDGERLIPYVKAAQAVKPNLRFWASPWTPPVWMKTGYTEYGGDSDVAGKPSYYDGGTMRDDVVTLAAYAEYFKKFVEGYRAQGIDIEVVSPQNEPGYQLNYPSCLWDKTTYTRFVGDFLGPTLLPLGVKVMLGTFANGSYGKDFDIASTALADATATSFLSVIGAQWGALDANQLAELDADLPVWATEHKGGNYPFQANYVAEAAPNDHAYGVESWGYIREAITKIGVTSYNAWNMVLDKVGWSLDTSRDWAQDALLVADGGRVMPTPAYYVFRHVSQYAVPGAKVVRTSGGDAVAFQNPDGSLVAVLYNSGPATDAYVVAIGGKKFQFAMPQSGWATLKYGP
jgi:glucosylceramidase